MWLQASVTTNDVQDLADRMFPLRIDLTGDRMVYIGKPTRIEMNGELWLEIESHGRVRWPLLGVKVPIDVPTVRAALRPTIQREGTDSYLTLNVELTELDVTHSPDALDHMLMRKINEELAKTENTLRWRFTHTLTFDLELPNAVEPARKLHMICSYGAVKVTPGGLALAASLTPFVEKNGEQGDEDAARDGAPIAKDSTQSGAHVH